MIVYIDGFNLYFGLRSKGWKKYYWLNLQAFSQSLLTSTQTLGHTKYFTSKISKPYAKSRRQAAFLSALGTLANFTIYYGRYQSFPATCRNCGHTHIVDNEKKSDVNLATQLIVDAFQDHYDTAILVSADSDLVPPILAVQELFPNKIIKVAFPPERSSFELKSVVKTSFTIYESKFRNNQFPDRVILPSGHTIFRPESWR